MSPGRVDFLSCHFCAIFPYFTHLVHPLGDVPIPAAWYPCAMLPSSIGESAHYQIHLRGELDPRWSVWFNDFIIHNQAGDCLLIGPVSDQAALHGVLARIRDLGLTLVSIQLIEPHCSQETP